MNILVTGSSGTIGTRLCETLLSMGHTVVGADWEPCKWSTKVEQLRVNIDLRDNSQFSILNFPRLPSQNASVLIILIISLGRNILSEKILF